MQSRIILAIGLLLLARCDVETVETKPGDLQLYVPEERFVAIKPGMSAEEVSKKLGPPRRKEGKSQNVWVFGVWRGDEPSFLRWLFTSSPIKQATLLEGRISFVGGRVVETKVVESSAVPLAHPQRAP